MSLSLTEIFFLFGLGFTLAAPIGPVNVEMLKQTLTNTRGWLYGIITGLGAITGDFIIASSVLYFGSEFLEDILDIKLVNILLLSANVLILSYVGISALRMKNNKFDKYDDEKNDILQINEQNVPSIVKQATIGFALVVTSPWSYLWWATFGTYIFNLGFALDAFTDRLQVTFFFIIGIFMWVLIFVGSLSFSKKVASPRILNLITKSSATLILIFAGGILFQVLKIIF